MIFDYIGPGTFLPFVRGRYQIGTPVPRTGEIVVIPNHPSKEFKVEKVAYDYQDPNDVRIVIEVTVR